MPLEQKKIDALRLKVNFKQKKDGKSFETDVNGKLIERTREEKLKEIALLDSKETIPFIINIIDQLTLVLSKNQDKELEPTKKYLGYAKTYLTDADKKQNAGKIDQIIIFKEIVKNPAQIINDLKKFEDEAKQVKVNEPSLVLWSEAELWLEGWYKQTFDIYIKKYKSVDVKRPNPKNSNIQIYKTIDVEDDAFSSATNFCTCKMEVAEAYHRISIIIKTAINEHLEKAKQAKNQLTQNPVTISPQPNTNGNTNVKPGDNAAYNFHELVKLTKTNGKTSNISINLPPNSESSLEKDLLAAISHILGRQNDEDSEVLRAEPQEQFSEATLPMRLNELKDDEEDIKLKMFRYQLAIIPLFPGQVKMLENFKDDIISVLKRYNDRWYTFKLPFFKVEVSIPKSRPAYHGQQASDLIDSISTPNQDGSLKNPVQILNLLFDAMHDLNKDQSQTLLPLIRKEILNVFEMLRKYKGAGTEVKLQQAVSPHADSQTTLFKSQRELVKPGSEEPALITPNAGKA